MEQLSIIKRLNLKLENMMLFILGGITSLLLLFIGCKASKRIRDFVTKTVNPDPIKPKTVNPDPDKP